MNAGPGPRSVATAPAFWQEPEARLLERLQATPAGLDGDEAERRLRRDGPNALAARPRRHIVAELGRRLANPLIVILLVAAAIAGATGDMPSFAIIVAVVVLSIGLELVQERRAEATAEALKRSIALRATVVRDGRPQEIPVEHLVAGDIVELAAGDLVPADGLVLAANGAIANEALLTGEPYPVEKRPGDGSAAETPAVAANALFHGTSLVGGTATMLVVLTGQRTHFGAIARALATRPPPSAFETGIRRLGTLIVRLTVFLVLFVLLAHLALGRPPLESFLFAVALAVGLTPELLPMIMTVALAHGAERMAAARVVVKRLSAIHDLGQMDILCTDKTGTLTEARIELVGSPGVDGSDDPQVAALGAVNARFEAGLRSPLDAALLARAPADPGWTRLDELPFDFERRRVAVLAERQGERLVIVKGAPESLLPLCIGAGLPTDPTVALDATLRAAVDALAEARAGEGLRLLAIAWKRQDGAALGPDAESDLVLAGFCMFVDPPKPSAAAAIARLEAQGVRVKVISGDAAPVIRHLVATLKLPAAGLMTGDEIEGLSDVGLAARVGSVDLFARVTPEHKTRIVRALRARGHTVGFMGDGINDAPAIHAADVGLSVEGATDVAREAADMILLAPDLGVLADGVAEGRRTYANIMKYIRMGTSSNFGNMLTMAVASLFLPFLPLTAVQVLVNNLLYDLSQVGIPFDSVDPGDVARPEGLNLSGLMRFTAIMGPLSSLFDIATFAVLIYLFHVDVAAFRTAWFLESMATQVLVVFVIRTLQPAWRSRPDRRLVVTALGGLAVAFLLPFLPWAGLMGFAALPPALLGALLLLVLAYLVGAEALKRAALRPARTAAASADDRADGRAHDRADGRAHDRA